MKVIKTLYIYIQGRLYRTFFKGEVCDLYSGYKNRLDDLQYFQSLPDSEKYPPPFVLEVHGRKLKRDWDGACDIKLTGGYYDVEITKDAERQLGSEIFDKLDKRFEEIDGVEEVFWYGRDGMQVATTLGKKDLENALKAKYDELKPKDA